MKVHDWRDGEFLLAAVGFTGVAVFSFWIVLSGGSRLRIEPSACEGKPGGIQYEFGLSEASLISAFAVMPLLGSVARRRAAKAESLRGSFWDALCDAFGSNAFTSIAWPLIIIAWILATDTLALVPGHLLPPPGRLAQVGLEEARSGRFFQAAFTTCLRNGTALVLALTVAAALTTFFSEWGFLRRTAMPLCIFSALVPPLFLFGYSPWLGAILHSESIRVWLIDLGLDPNGSFFRVFGYPDRLLILALMGLWPLLISALVEYSRFGDRLRIEIESLSLPPFVAVKEILLPATVRAMTPAIYIAIVLIFVTCVEAEMVAATLAPTDGLAKYYLRTGYDNINHELTFFSLFALGILAQLFLLLCDATASYFTGVRHEHP
ncbi:MAG: hypothetical protein HYU36_25300 [Planctomycetes bacterium]|nr:hypothetical protein [Planctomycetota bacterium]